MSLSQCHFHTPRSFPNSITWHENISGLPLGRNIICKCISITVFAVLQSNFSSAISILLNYQLWTLFEGRRDHSAELLTNQLSGERFVVVSGGLNDSGIALDTVEVLNIDEGKWIQGNY